jgi:hypothetical protein
MNFDMRLDEVKLAQHQDDGRVAAQPLPNYIL